MWCCVWFSVCSLCLGAWFNVFVCFVCGELCEVVWFAVGDCCVVSVCFWTCVSFVCDVLCGVAGVVLMVCVFMRVCLKMRLWCVL